MLQNAMSVAKICAIRSTLGSEKTSYTCYQVQQRLTSSYHIIPVSFFHVFSFSLPSARTGAASSCVGFRSHRAGEAGLQGWPMPCWWWNSFLFMFVVPLYLTKGYKRLFPKFPSQTPQHSRFYPCWIQAQPEVMHSPTLFRCTALCHLGCHWLHFFWLAQDIPCISLCLIIWWHLMAGHCCL